MNESRMSVATALTILLALMALALLAAGWIVMGVGQDELAIMLGLTGTFFGLAAVVTVGHVFTQRICSLGRALHGVGMARSPENADLRPIN